MLERCRSTRVGAPFGGAAIDERGDPLPRRRSPPAAPPTRCCSARSAARSGTAAAVRPEQGLIGLRKAARRLREPAARRRQGDIDLLIVRELVGGLYYGARGVRDDGTVFDTCEYHPSQVERDRAARVRARRAAAAARSSRSTRRTCSTPRACGAASSTRSRPTTPTSSCVTRSSTASRWRSSRRPSASTCVVTENTFGDILSDVAAAVTGGLGLAASASLGDGGPGIFEPVHGSAPDIAGTGSANPTAMLRSLALAARARARRLDLAAALDAAVDAALARHADARRRRRRHDDRVRRRRAGGARGGPCRRRGRDERHRRLPRPARQPQRRGGVGARPRRRVVGRPAELHRGRRGRDRGGGGARRAADRELADRPDRRDARPALRGAALDRARGDAADRHCLLGAPGATAREATTLRSHPAAFDQCRDLLAASRRAVHPGGDDGRRGARGRRGRRPRPGSRSRAPRPRARTGSR